jgi:hypothetical protein
MVERKAISGRMDFNLMNLLEFSILFSRLPGSAGLAEGFLASSRRKSVHRLIHMPGCYGRG